MSETTGYYLVCCTQVLLQDIVCKQFTQRDIAVTYSMALRSAAAGASSVDWETVNKAIIDRWSMSGLERIKKLAWDFAEGRKTP